MRLHAWNLRPAARCAAQALCIVALLAIGLHAQTLDTLFRTSEIVEVGAGAADDAVTFHYLAHPIYFENAGTLDTAIEGGEASWFVNPRSPWQVTSFYAGQDAAAQELARWMARHGRWGKLGAAALLYADAGAHLCGVHEWLHDRRLALR